METQNISLSQQNLESYLNFKIEINLKMQTFN